MALFPLRPVLLREHPQPHLHLVPAFQFCLVRSLLLHVTRVSCIRGNHMEEQSCLPRLRQSHVAVHSHLRSAHVHGHKVRVQLLARVYVMPDTEEHRSLIRVV